MGSVTPQLQQKQKEFNPCAWPELPYNPSLIPPKNVETWILPGNPVIPELRRFPFAPFTRGEIPVFQYSMGNVG